MDVYKLLAAAANHSGLLNLCDLLGRKESKAVILIYHRVNPTKDAWSLEALSPESFEEQIGYLCRTYEILTLDTLAQDIWQRRALPGRAAVITFDDGYKDNYLYAYPIIRRYHVPATIFLTTSYISAQNLFWWDEVGYIIQNTSLETLELPELGYHRLSSQLDRFKAKQKIRQRLVSLPEDKKRFVIGKLGTMLRVSIPPGLGKELTLSWDEVTEMSNNGIAFGAHSATHPVLPDLSAEQAHEEVIRSKKEIEQRLDQTVTTFSYPHGYFNDGLIRFMAKSGFTCAVAASPELITLESNPYALGRVWTDEDFGKFKVMLSVPYLALKQYLRRKARSNA